MRLLSSSIVLLAGIALIGIGKFSGDHDYEGWGMFTAFGGGALFLYRYYELWKNDQEDRDKSNPGAA